MTWIFPLGFLLAAFMFSVNAMGYLFPAVSFRDRPAAVLWVFAAIGGVSMAYYTGRPEWHL